MAVVDDADAIRARYDDADAEASDRYQPHVRKIRRSLDDIPVLVDKVTELRAVLAPLLDRPFIAGQDGDACVWCLGLDDGLGDANHEPDCPVLRKNELLGRASP